VIQIQATFVGYGGRPCSLFSAYDAAARVLVVGAEAEYRTERRAGCVVLTNDKGIARDSFFSDADLADAIAAFYTLKSGVAADGKSARIAFADRAARANPEQSIEKDGLDQGGPRYRIAEDITCAQVAALATCHHALRAETIERTVEAADFFNRLKRGGIVRI